MARINKKTRIKGLPPKLQLQQEDATTGSFPSQVRISSDNRTGNYDVLWNDTNAINFLRYSNLELGIGINSGSQFIKYPSEQLTDITTTGSLRKGVGDQIAHFTPGQGLTPFRDYDNPAVDGKSDNNSFYATGSNPLVFGDELKQPLWSKTKLEIDISVDSTCGAALFVSGADWGNATRPSTATDGLSYEMLYYNFVNKTWQGIGTGTPTGFVSQGAANIAPPVPFGNHIMYGFTPGIVASNNLITSASVSGAFAFMNNAGRPTNTFGFPFHGKYHATSSQTLSLSSYISEPFLVEKIVVELSAAYTVFSNTMTTASLGVTHITQSVIPAAINNFFILNQRSFAKYRYVDSYQILGRDDGTLVTEVPTVVTLSANGTAQTVSTNRDIITWGGISSFAANISTSSQRYPGTYYFGNVSTFREDNPKSLMTRDFVFESNENAENDLSSLSWAGRVKLELLAGSPNKDSIFDSPVIDPINGVDLSRFLMRFQAGPGTYREGIAIINYGGPYVNYKNGNRNGLGLLFPTGRSRSSEIASLQATAINEDLSTSTTIVEPTPDNFLHINPYLLLPSDQLVIGWQQPITDFVNGETALPGAVLSEINFLPGDAKITIYGSPLRQDREEHDTLNQLLTSESVHEVIE